MAALNGQVYWKRDLIGGEWFGARGAGANEGLRSKSGAENGHMSGPTCCLGRVDQLADFLKKRKRGCAVDGAALGGARENKSWINSKQNKRNYAPQLPIMQPASQPTVAKTQSWSITAFHTQLVHSISPTPSVPHRHTCAPAPTHNPPIYPFCPTRHVRLPRQRPLCE